MLTCSSWYRHKKLTKTKKACSYAHTEYNIMQIKTCHGWIGERKEVQRIWSLQVSCCQNNNGQSRAHAHLLSTVGREAEEIYFSLINFLSGLGPMSESNLSIPSPSSVCGFGKRVSNRSAQRTHDAPNTRISMKLEHNTHKEKSKPAKMRYYALGYLNFPCLSLSLLLPSFLLPLRPVPIHSTSPHSLFYPSFVKPPFGPIQIWYRGTSRCCRWEKEGQYKCTLLWLFFMVSTMAKATKGKPLHVFLKKHTVRRFAAPCLFDSCSHATLSVLG